MKLFKKVLMAAFMVASLQVTAQTADEIVGKNIEAMGGAAKLATLTSAKKTGTLSAQGYDIPLTMTIMNQKGFRLDLDIMGTSNYQLVTPEKGFMFFPIQGMTEPKELEPEQLKSMQSSLDVTSMLYNYKEKGSTVALAGTEKVDGVDMNKITLTNKSGNASTVFIDAKSNRVMKVVTKSKGPDGAEAEQAITYADYKQNADGYWFAYSTTSPQGTIVFDKIETNIKVDENIFKN